MFGFLSRANCDRFKFKNCFLPAYQVKGQGDEGGVVDGGREATAAANI